MRYSTVDQNRSEFTVVLSLSSFERLKESQVVKSTYHCDDFNMSFLCYFSRCLCIEYSETL